MLRQPALRRGQEPVVTAACGRSASGGGAGKPAGKRKGAVTAGRQRSSLLRSRDGGTRRPGRRQYSRDIISLEIRVTTDQQAGEQAADRGGRQQGVLKYLLRLNQTQKVK